MRALLLKLPILALLLLGAATAGTAVLPGCGAGGGYYYDECCELVWYPCCGYIEECYICKDGPPSKPWLENYYQAERSDGVLVKIPGDTWFDPENPTFDPIPRELY